MMLVKFFSFPEGCIFYFKTQKGRIGHEKFRKLTELKSNNSLFKLIYLPLTQIKTLNTLHFIVLQMPHMCLFKNKNK